MILFTVGDDIYGRFPAVSSRHGFNRYRLADHPGDERRADRRRRTEAEGRAACGKRAGAPPGKRWVGDTCRRHEMTPPNGRVPALVVAGGGRRNAFSVPSRPSAVTVDNPADHCVCCTERLGIILRPVGKACGPLPRPSKTAISAGLVHIPWDPRRMVVPGPWGWDRI